MLAQTARCDAALLDGAHARGAPGSRRRPRAELTARGRRRLRRWSCALVYLRGLAAAQAAYAQGGDDASLAPVRAAIASVGGARARWATWPRLSVSSLRAAVAAAQSERDEMSVLLAQALQVERAPGRTRPRRGAARHAHEMAGELWLQVHRYDEAAAAYRVARGSTADSPRITAGLARALARQDQVPQACEEYRRLTAQAGACGRR